MKMIKRISAVILAAAISAVCSVTAFAAPKESTVVSENSPTSSTQKPQISAQKSGNEESSNEVSGDDNTVEITDSSKNSEKNKNDYDFSDKTIGNAVLTANENVITDDSNYQFIAATTRDGNVFYIIIDNLKTTDNVYFLNQVDTFDLNALLNSGEDDETVRVGANTQKATDEESKGEENEKTNEDEDNLDGEDPNSMTTPLIMLIGIAVLGVIGFVIFKMKKGGKLGKKQPELQMLDDDFDDDEEINEDKE